MQALIVNGQRITFNYEDYARILDELTNGEKKQKNGGVNSVRTE